MTDISATSPAAPTPTGGAVRAERPQRPERLWRELVGEQLRGIRRSRGETIGSVATRAGVSPQYLSEVERGKKEPSSEILAAIGWSLDTTLLDLATGVSRRLGEAAAAPTPPSRSDVTLAA